MKTVIYTGPGHVLVADGHRIRRGVPASISEELYRQLQRDPSMVLQLVPEPEPETSRPRRTRTRPPRKAVQEPASEADSVAGNGEEEQSTDG